MKNFYKIASIIIAAVFMQFSGVTVAAEENYKLPSGYVEVEYVESHGQEWIDTGFVPTNKTRSEVDYQVTVANPESSMGIYGAYRGTRHQIFYSTISGNVLSYGVGKGAAYVSLDTERHYAVLDAKNASVTVDGISFPSGNGNSYTSQNASASIYIFGAHQPDDYSSYSRIYGAKIYENDVLVHSYIPCYSESETEYGMYDVVEGIFLKNSSKAGKLTGPEKNNACTVTFAVPEGVSLKVFSGFADKTTGALSFESKETMEGKDYYRCVLPVGKYHFISEGSGYYTYHKNFIITKSDIESGEKQIDANPGKRAESGKYDCLRTIYSFTDELYASELLSIENALSQYPGLLETPAFSEEKAFGEYTSYKEMKNFIFGFDDSEDNLNIFTVGKTGKGKDIYLTVHTKSDIEGKNLEETAEILSENGKPTICVYGFIHGLEPSGGEGPLALIKMLDGKYGEKVLEKVNIIIIPWINADGAEKYLYGTPSGCGNLNRYNLMPDYPEVKATHLVYNLFVPEVVVAAHEKGFHTNGGQSESGTLIDASLDISVNRNNTDEIRIFSKEMMKSVIELAKEDGFRMDRHEQDNVSGQYPVVETSYFGLRGSISFLVEVPGIRSGKDFYGRRVASQFFAAENIIEYVYENSEEVKNIVSEEREHIAKIGSVFDSEDKITLRHCKNSEADWVIETPVYNYTDGSIKNPSGSTKVVFWEEAFETRTRPTAYVIPADAENIDYILKTLEYNNISYYKLEKGDSVFLRRYSGSVTEATLNEEGEYQFKNGAYVFPMNQPDANALAMLMEPDVYQTDSYAVSFAQSKKISITDIYRCEQDLVDGKIPVENKFSIADLNLDGTVDVKDAYFARLVAAKLREPTEQQIFLGDVDLDGRITAIDANIIRKYAVGIIRELPAV